MDETGDRPASGGWARRRERLSLEIERVALRLFAQVGPKEVTAEQIAAAAGISSRTFFRYFANRDEILAAVPRRALENLSECLKARPRSESILEAFAAAGRAADDDDDRRELVLLWGIVVHRSPTAATKALTQATVGMVETFQALIADRLGLDPDDQRAGTLGAALAGAVSFTYRRWVQSTGRMDLGDMLAEAFDSFRDLQAAASQPVV
jgi:AcrR family transcriptional regulator